MISFKTRWEIQNNWQLLWPLSGLLALFLSCLKLSFRFFEGFSNYTIFAIAIISFVIGLKLTVWIIDKLAKRWSVNYRFELIVIFIVFALTGSSTAFVSRTFMRFIGIDTDHFPMWLYWILITIGGFIFYQFFLMFFAAIVCGQFQLLLELSKEDASKRFGLKV